MTAGAWSRSDIGAEVRAAVYLDAEAEAPTHSQALAVVFWPLVCSTNYDGVYLRATLVKRLVVPRIDLKPIAARY